MSDKRPIRPRAYALVSGGKDSMTLAHVLASQDMLAGVVAIDTGIAVPEWRPFIEDACRAQGWELHIVGTLLNYDDLVRKMGFPGAALHDAFMGWLKGRAMQIFKRRNPDALFASGLRRLESKRRFGKAREWNVWDGYMTIWAPIINWTTEEVWAYVHEHNLPRSPAYAMLGVSGDCLCGAFAQPDEREIIAEHYPAIDARLCGLEREVCGKWGVGKARRRSATKAEQLICVECDPSGRPESGTR